MEKRKTITAAIAASLALATMAPAASAAVLQHHGPTPYYQAQHDHRWSDHRDRRDHRSERRHYRRDMSAERQWREREWRQEHRSRNNNRDAAFAFVAGTIIGSVINDRSGERRQYYRDPQTNRYYYYNYDRNVYAWDYNYRPGYR